MCVKYAYLTVNLRYMKITDILEHICDTNVICGAGRRDAAVPDPADRLPEETLSAEALRLNFAAKGMSARELVALSGAHTVRYKPLVGCRRFSSCLEVSWGASSALGGTCIPHSHL